MYISTFFFFCNFRLLLLAEMSTNYVMMKKIVVILFCIYLHALNKTHIIAYNDNKCVKCGFMVYFSRSGR